jgi:hypothetical protein
MPADMQKLLRDKELILSSINTRGPSLPVHAARAANLSILFASAFLSELFAEGKVKMSRMKVGSSSLYYLSGQEAKLENFVEYLNSREKEAFYLLKKEKILSDEIQEPAIRVALRAISDFAIPIKINVDGEQKICWKHFLISDAELKEILQERFGQGKKKEKAESQASLVQKTAETPQERGEFQEVQAKKEAKPKKKVQNEESPFTKKIKAYLLKHNIEVLSAILEKKKDFTAKISINTLFGKQEYCLIAKDKKKISDDDLAIAIQKAQAEKMPALFLSSGDIDKKSQNYLNEWRNLIKFEKISS